MADENRSVIPYSVMVDQIPDGEEGAGLWRGAVHIAGAYYFLNKPEDLQVSQSEAEAHALAFGKDIGKALLKKQLKGQWEKMSTALRGRRD